MYNKFRPYIESLNDEAIVYVFLHQNADPDALCSAVAIKDLILFMRSEITIKLFVDSLNVSAKRIAKTIEVEIMYDVPQIQPDLIITVDTANFSQFNKFESFVKSSTVPKIVIDHHKKSELADFANLTIHDTELGSTCLIVAKLFESIAITPSPKVSTILICGHIYDSRRFIHGTTSAVFRLVADLIDYGGNYSEANQYLQNDMTLGEKIARIKASKRINYRIINKLLIATTSVSAFEASAARSLIGMGCDSILVLAKKGNEIRGSGRTNLQNDLHMGEILSQLTKEFENEMADFETKLVFSSGGHRNAAGLNIKPPLSNKQQQKFMNRFLDIVEKLLSTNVTNK
ncbi:MAG: hypothetical protein GPJ54_07390 [Candidatus Heimdallarchaeota archaeon]|nr:hypothetical protein [Candidatus Heimdallarchaeota archaeon]